LDTRDRKHARRNPKELAGKVERKKKQKKGRFKHGEQRSSSQGCSQNSNLHCRHLHQLCYEREGQHRDREEDRKGQETSQSRKQIRKRERTRREKKDK
jgi:hypothetical protein